MKTKDSSSVRRREVLHSYHEADIPTNCKNRVIILDTICLSGEISTECRSSWRQMLMFAHKYVGGDLLLSAFELLEFEPAFEPRSLSEWL